MDVNFIITCFNREGYLPYLLNIINSYKEVKAKVAVCYNGGQTAFPCDVKIANLGHQMGDVSLTRSGYAHLKSNGTARFIKIGIDSWLLDENSIIDIFNRMEKEQACYAGNWWGGSSLSTDIMFVDTRYGDPLEKLTGVNSVSSFESFMFKALEGAKFKYYVIPEREKVHSENRYKCDKLHWCMFHNLNENIAYAEKFLKCPLQTVPKLEINPGDIKVITEHPVAVDSPDHLQPMGTKQDNYTNPKFIEVMNALLRIEFTGQQLAYMDLGCSGGQVVKDFSDQGYITVGLEGSDYSLLNKRANWAELANKNLFTCDIAKPFKVTYKNIPQRFQLITAWEVLEHLKESDLDTLFHSIIEHLAPEGYFVASTSSNSVIQGGLELHQTRWAPEKWKEYLKKFTQLEPAPLNLTPQQCVRSAETGGSSDYLFYKLRTVRIQLGCGTNYRTGWTNFDLDPRVKADIYHDLNKGLPLEDNCADELEAQHVIEHLNDTIAIMKEIHRVVKPTGLVKLTVPHWQNPWAFGDPSHKHYFNEHTFDTFVPGLTGRVFGIDFFFTKISQTVANNEISVVLRPIK
jgi:SAM-dependent methyltransferase